MPESGAVIQSFLALIDQEEEVAEAFLLASLYACAIGQDDSPRSVLDKLFKSLPNDASWPALRQALLVCSE